MKIKFFNFKSFFLSFIQSFLAFLLILPLFLFILKTTHIFNGKDGRNGLDGIPGEKGDKGEKGKDGENGKDGKDGKSPKTPNKPNFPIYQEPSLASIEKLQNIPDWTLHQENSNQYLSFDNISKSLTFPNNSNKYFADEEWAYHKRLAAQMKDDNIQDITIWQQQFPVSITFNFSQIWYLEKSSIFYTYIIPVFWNIVNQQPKVVKQSFQEFQTSNNFTFQTTWKEKNMVKTTFNNMFLINTVPFFIRSNLVKLYEKRNGYSPNLRTFFLGQGNIKTVFNENTKHLENYEIYTDRFLAPIPFEALSFLLTDALTDGVGYLFKGLFTKLMSKFQHLQKAKRLLFKTKKTLTKQLQEIETQLPKLEEKIAPFKRNLQQALINADKTKKIIQEYKQAQKFASDQLKYFQTRLEKITSSIEHETNKLKELHQKLEEWQKIKQPNEMIQHMINSTKNQINNTARKLSDFETNRSALLRLIKEHTENFTKFTKLLEPLEAEYQNLLKAIETQSEFLQTAVEKYRTLTKTALRLKTQLTQTLHNIKTNIFNLRTTKNSFFHLTALFFKKFWTKFQQIIPYITKFITSKLKSFISWVSTKLTNLFYSYWIQKALLFLIDPPAVAFILENITKFISKFSTFLFSKISTFFQPMIDFQKHNYSKTSHWIQSIFPIFSTPFINNIYSSSTFKLPL